MRVQLPDGKIAEFPDSMSPDEVKAVLREKFPPSDQKEMSSPLLPNPSPGVVPAASNFNDTIQGLKDPNTWKGTGMGVGAGVGAALGLPFGPAGAVGGAAVGGAGGEAIEQIVMRFLGGNAPETSQEAMGEINKAAAFGGGSEMAPMAAGTLLKPFADKLGPLAKNLITRSQAENLPIKASALHPSKTAKFFEWTADSMAPGRMMTKRKNQQLLDGLEAGLKEVQESIPARTDKITAGESVGIAVKEAKTAATKRTRDAYQKFEEAITETFGNSPISTENTREAITKSIGKTAEGSAEREFLENTLRQIDSGEPITMSGEQLNYFQKNIWDNFYPKKKFVGRDLWDGLQKDIESEVSNLWPVLESAKDAKKLEKAFIQNPTLKAISQRIARGEPDKVILAMFRPGNFEQLKQVRQTMSAETWDLAKGRFVENIIDTGIDPQTGIFYPERFLKNYSNYQRQLENVAPEIAGRLDDFAEIMSRAVGTGEIGAKAAAKDNSLANTARMVFAGGPLGLAGKAALSGNPAAAVGFSVPPVFAALVSRSIRAPKGLFKKWLTTGLDAKALTGALRYGGKMGMTDQAGEQ